MINDLMLPQSNLPWEIAGQGALKAEKYRLPQSLRFDQLVVACRMSPRLTGENGNPVFLASLYAPWIPAGVYPREDGGGNDDF